MRTRSDNHNGGNQSKGLTCLLLCLFALGSFTAALAQENYEVKQVRFVGNRMFSSAELLEHIATYGTSGLQKAVLKKKPFLYSAEIADSDCERLLHFYQREGFLFARVEKSESDLDKRKKALIVTFNIVEGEPIVVGRVRYNFVDIGNGGVGGFDAMLKDVRPRLLLTEGSRFRDQAVQSDQDRLVRRLRNGGYPYAEVRPALSVDASSQAVDLTWTAESGPRSVFGAVKISGNGYASTGLIRKQLAFTAGQSYHQDLLDISQEQIYSLGMFHVVTVHAVLSSASADTIPVRIQVREAPRLTTKFGGGYGREDKVRVFSEVRQLAFLGGARRLNFSIKHSSLEPYRIDLKLAQPISPKSSFIFNPFVLRQTEPAFTVNRYGGNVTALHRISKTSSGSVVYSFERVDLDQSSLAESANGTAEVDLYNKSSATLALTRDTSSPLFTPAAGMFGALTFTFSGLGLNSQFHYTKIVLDLRRYHGITGGLVLASRVKLGALNSYDDGEFIPVEERFFAGGTSSVRGWARAELGPVSAEDVPVGGNSLLEASVELRYPIWGLVSGVLFSDFGNVWADSFNYELGDLRYALGFGLRVGTPIGPIRLDFARPIYDKNTAWQFYLSVGHAF